MKLAFTGANVFDVFTPFNRHPKPDTGDQSSFYDGRDLFTGFDEVVGSDNISSAQRAIIKYFDTNKDGKLDKSDCPPFKIRIVGYSWGGWSALKLANNLASLSKITDANKNVQIIMGTIDPVGTLRSKSGTGKSPLTIFHLNIYETTGMPGRVAGVSGKRFAGQSLPFANINYLISPSDHINIAVLYGPGVVRDILSRKFK